MRPLTLLILFSVISFGTAGQALAENPTAPIRISGYCVDEQGKGIEGAEVFLAEYAVEHRRLAQTTTGTGGFFEFVDIAMPYKKASTNGGADSGMFQVFGLADGFGFAWLPLSRFSPTEPKPKVVAFPVEDVSSLPKYYGGSVIKLKLVFPRSQTLSCRIVDDRGNPIEGALVSLRYCDTDVHEPDFSIMRGNAKSFDVLNQADVVPPDLKTRQTDRDCRAGEPIRIKFQMKRDEAAP